VDEVKTYFGMRTISIGADSRGFRQFQLNGKPVFLLGVLDEGYWPEGLYTAPTDDALRSDIEIAKRLGFNTIRKHVKIEPERWYYWCDKLGMLVWQDMPNGAWRTKDDHLESAGIASQFETELRQMVESRCDHPCIIGWVLFNQGWGQFDTLALTEKLKKMDPTRWVISASGWTDRGVGDVDSRHSYPYPEGLKNDGKRVLFLGEVGGMGFEIPGHVSRPRVFSHFPVPDADAFAREYTTTMRRVGELQKSAGLCGAVFTQLTDVEQEVTGLMTYDREAFKMDTNQIIRINREMRQLLP